ncbi:hypothetical protein Tco_1365960 [Tanacetum coccineum]
MYYSKKQFSTKDVGDIPYLIPLLPQFTIHKFQNDVELSTNGGTANLASQEANSSGSSFWNVNSSSLSTNPVIAKIDKIEKLIINGKVTLVDDEGKPLEKDVYSGDYNMEWNDSYENGDYEYDPYDDDMYKGEDIPDKLQAIWDNLDIKVRGRKKK